MIDIENVTSEISDVRVKMVTSDHREFWMELSEHGLAFFSDQSSSGNLKGTPVLKSVDDVFDWIRNEKPGLKMFGQRKGLVPKRNR